MSWLVPVAVLAAACAGEGAKSPVIKNGSKVSIEYTLKLDDGTVADTNVGREPLAYVQGEGQILPSLEEALEGLGKDDTKQVSLSAEQGYGPVNDELYETVPADVVPEDARVVGTQLVAQSPSGEQRPVRVHELKGEEIVMDLNHPLAGEALHFDIKILGIE